MRKGDYAAFNDDCAIYQKWQSCMPKQTIGMCTPTELHAKVSKKSGGKSLADNGTFFK
jgi:hypothetical protein